MDIELGVLDQIRRLRPAWGSSDHSMLKEKSLSHLVGSNLEQTHTMSNSHVYGEFGLFLMHSRLDRERRKAVVNYSSLGLLSWACLTR